MTKERRAGRHHPEEQGLKQPGVLVQGKLVYKPVGIIQKNKD